jgi:3'(2'), 5'-bisphosphate nucleotidase
MHTHSFAAEYEVARSLALEAGRAILFSRAVRSEEGASPTSLPGQSAGTEILAGIRRHFPGDAALTAESPQEQNLPLSDRVWVVDLLGNVIDSAEDRPDPTIVIGLTVAATPVIGVVYFPARLMLYGAAWGAGAWVEEGRSTRPLHVLPPVGDTLRMIAPPASTLSNFGTLRNDLNAREICERGSAGTACAMITEGAADLYIDPTRTLKDWHCCAPDLILREAGGSVTNCYGEPISYHKPSPDQRLGFVACGPGVLDAVLPRISHYFASAHARETSNTISNRDRNSHPADASQISAR